MKELFSIPATRHGFGHTMFAWQPGGNLLASAGQKGLISVYDRHGEYYAEFSTQKPVKAIQWDRNGDYLALIQKGMSVVSIWNARTKKITELTSSLQDPTCLKWSKISDKLAVGDSKGNLLLYDSDHGKKNELAGKHGGAITCVAWSNTDILALGSEDNKFSLSNADGKTFEELTIKAPALDVQFSRQKVDGRDSQIERTISVNIGGKSLLLYNIDDPGNPIELAFQVRYGDLVAIQWFGDGYLIVGFSEGFFVIISTHMKEIGEEIYSIHLFKEGGLSGIKYSAQTNRAFIVANKTIKVLENSANTWSPLEHETVILDSERNDIEDLGLSEDGQIVTVSTTSGTVRNFLSSLPLINGFCVTTVAYLSSLREVSIFDTLRGTKPQTIGVDMEPSFLTLGEEYIAVGMNNKVIIYQISTGKQVDSIDYLNSVKKCIITGEFIAALYGNKLDIREIGNNGNNNKKHIIFPPDNDSYNVTAVGGGNGFIYYSTSNSQNEVRLNIFYTIDFVTLDGCGINHNNKINIIECNVNGTRAIFVDDKGIYMFVPSTKALSLIPYNHTTNIKILWDVKDDGGFIIQDNDNIHSFIFSDTSIHGEICSELGNVNISDNGEVIIKAQSTLLNMGNIPITCYDGLLTCQSASGSIDELKLHSHDKLVDDRPQASNAFYSLCFQQNLALLRLQEAWQVAVKLKSKKCWLALGNKAMEQLDIDMAIKVFRHLGDAGMVLSLREISNEENKNLLAAHIWMLYGDYDKAQELYLSSNKPTLALTMRCDLQNWQIAIDLAKTLEPSKLPEISLSYAHQLEFHQQYHDALDKFEEALKGLKDKKKIRECKSGIARCCMRSGDITRGKKIVMEIQPPDESLCTECASILDSMNQFSDAALLYEKGNQYEKAAKIYIQNKNYKAAEPLMKKIASPKLHGLYAKAMEAEKKYDLAVRGYEFANDIDNIVRILVENLKQYKKAFELTRKLKSQKAALICSKYCEDIKDYKSCVEFLLIGNKNDMAFRAAQDHNEMESYMNMLRTLNNSNRDDFKDVAEYYVQKEDYEKAGDCFNEIGEFYLAFRNYLQNGGESSIDKAIDVVVKTNSSKMSLELTEYLESDVEGSMKEKYIMKLYVSKGQFKKAAEVGLAIALDEQRNGNYTSGHTILCDLIKDMRRERGYAPLDIVKTLEIIHSYVLVKKLVAIDDHIHAALMLERVIENLSYFPKNIYTSAVIECRRAKLKEAAFQYASELMKPENRNNLDPKFKKKFEEIVRKPSHGKDPEFLSPCPFCKSPVNDIKDVCNNCKNTIPFDIVTGTHLVPDDICLCPKCNFPAKMSVLKEYITKSPNCPMCGEVIQPLDIQPVKDIPATLKLLTNVIPEVEDNEDDSGIDKKNETTNDRSIKPSQPQGPLL